MSPVYFVTYVPGPDPTFCLTAFSKPLAKNRRRDL